MAVLISNRPVQPNFCMAGFLGTGCRVAGPYIFWTPAPTSFGLLRSSVFLLESLMLSLKYNILL